MVNFKPQTATLIHLPTALDMAEYAARLCYNSSKPQREDYDQVKFLKALAHKGHLTPFEHAWFAIPIGDNFDDLTKEELQAISKVSGRPRNEVVWDNILDFVVANMRTFIEVVGTDKTFDLAQKFNKDYYEAQGWYTFEIITSRAIGNQLIRHRSLSFESTWELPEFSVNQESLRWVPQGEPSVCIGETYKKMLDKNPGIKADWIHSICRSFEDYSHLCDNFKKEFARTVLPLCTATRLLMTGNGHTWAKFLELRLDKAAEPQMRELAIDIFMQLKDYLTLSEGYCADAEPFRTILQESSCS